MNLIGQNFQKEQGGVFTEYKYTKIFGLFDLMFLNSVQFMVQVVISTLFIKPIMNKLDQESNHASFIYRLFVLFGIVTLGLAYVFSS